MGLAVILGVTLALCGAGVSPALAANPNAVLVSQSLQPAAHSLQPLNVEPVWSGHPVGFSLLTHGGRQFVAYYDAQRRMKVAARVLDSNVWDIVELPEQLGWDSHNYVTMAVDDEGFIHLSGNMHVKPLVYFRTTRPLDIHSFERAPMVGEKEDRVTYPAFFRGPENALVFTYRDGQSGQGDQIYNVYDQAAKSWRRLIDTPLTSGQGKMNAYFHGPIKGPDGLFHLCWVWRDNPGCESNHDPCYARSADLVHWQTAAGNPLDLPITLENADVVDPVPAGGGIINGNVKLGFDSKNRPIVSYHKFDAAGKTQIYNARFENGAWKSVQASEWNYRWAFSGGGCIVFEIQIGGVAPHAPGLLKQTGTHSQYGPFELLLDEETLKPLSMSSPKTAPKEPAPGNAVPRMETRRASDLGAATEPGITYSLEWETLPPNRDRPREGDPPPPSMLRVVKHPKTDYDSVNTKERRPNWPRAE